MADVVKTATFPELRNILSAEIHRLRTGETSPANVNAVCNAIGKFLGTVKVELEIDRLAGRKPHAMMAALEAPAAETETVAPPESPKKPN